MDGRVGAVVALKPFARAKSRITGVQRTLRHQLARSMALDTLTALRAGGTQVLVISDQPDLADTLAWSGLSGIRVLAEAPSEHGHRGLNQALTQGDRVLRSAGFDTVLACVADLPALRAEHVRRVVQAHLATSVRTFLGDADGVGTTMLLATDVDLDPFFQGNSAERHRESGAVALTDAALGASIPGARRDVDDLASLAGAVENGVGPHTRALLERARDLLQSPA